MDSKPLVVVDTNRLNSESSFSLLLGNRDELSAIVEVADLLIPAVAIDEVIEHKRQAFIQDVTKAKRNHVLRLCNVDWATLALPSFEDIELSLRSDQSIPYRVIKPHDPGRTFEKLYGLAVRHEAPFEEKSDKGFKDGCIVASVDDYLDDNPDVSLYLLTGDVRLASYFSTNPRVTHVTSCGDLLALIGVGRWDEHGVPNASEEVACAPEAPSVPKSDPEIIEDLQRLAEELRFAGSFQGTHSVIKQLGQLDGTIGRVEGVGLLRAAVRNDQVYGILRDDDVWGCLYPLFKSYGDGLDDDEYGVFVDYGDLPYEREEDPYNVHFTRSERAAFGQVVNALGDHLANVGAMASVRSPAEIIERFERVLSRNQLSRTVSCKELLAAVIDGLFSSYDGAIFTSALRDFLDRYRRASDVKKEAVMGGLANKVETAEVDYSDMPF